MPEAPAPFVQRLNAELETRRAEDSAAGQGDLIGRSFELSPTVELQVLSALKRGENTYETFIAFRPGRQADFLVAYLILRRLGGMGTVLAALPSVDEIENGQCGSAIQALWSTPLGEAEVEERLEALGPFYGITECHSIQTTVFQYEAGEAG